MFLRNAIKHESGVVSKYQARDFSDGVFVTGTLRSDDDAHGVERDDERVSV
jgi:hypothetical protein